MTLSETLPLIQKDRRRAALEREAELWRHAVGAHQRLGFLSEASRALNETLEPEKVLESLARLAVPRVAEWCVIDVLDESGRLVLAGAADVDPSKAALVRELRRRFPPEPGRHFAYRVMREGAPVLGRDCGGLRMRGPFVCVPIRARSGALGALTFGRRRGPALSAADVALGLELAARAGAAVENARLYEKARQSDALLSRALSATRMVAWSWDLKTDRIERSANAAEIYGAASAEEIGRGLQLIHPDDRPRYQAVLARAAADGAPYVERFRMLRRDGAVSWMEEHGGMTGPSRLSGVVMDVTAQKLAEDRLERKRREQQIILDSVPAMIWYKDGNNRVLRCNRAAAQWYGKPACEIEGRTACELFPERGEEYHRDDLAVLGSGKPKLGQVEECVSPAGAKCWVRRDLIPLTDERGRPDGVIIFAVDITKIKQAEQALRESERLQRDFVANVSHEFRTPVAAIKGFAETLRRGALKDRKNRLTFVRTIESHADRLDWLVQDLLNLSRLGSGMVKLKRQALPLRDFLDEYLRSVSSIVERAGARVEVEAGRGLVVMADRPHLVQVLDNLLSNALKYGRRGGRIRFEARALGRRARLSVRDDGAGIAAEHLPRLFDRFYRVSKGDGGGSTGLGLHIVKTIMEAQGGAVTVESEPGKGTAFHLSLARSRSG